MKSESSPTPEFQVEKNPEQTEPKTEPNPKPLSTLPSHFVLKKDGTLKERLKEVVEDQEGLEQEFRKLEEYILQETVQGHVRKDCNTGRLEVNVPHNRYLDIGQVHLKIIPVLLSSSVPFNANVIHLTSPLFAPPATNYVNASTIEFPDCSQKFIAAQAPKPVSFSHFWHMVIQEEVRRLNRW